MVAARYQNRPCASEAHVLWRRLSPASDTGGRARRVLARSRGRVAPLSDSAQRRCTLVLLSGHGDRGAGAETWSGRSAAHVASPLETRSFPCRITAARRRAAWTTRDVRQVAVCSAA